MTTALEGVKGQRQAPTALYPRERPGTHFTGGWVGPMAGLDRFGESLPTGIRSPDRPARSQPLYRLNYPTHSALVPIRHLFHMAHSQNQCTNSDKLRFRSVYFKKKRWD